MSLRNTDVKTPGIAAIAKKWNLPVAHVAKLVEIGAKTEFEHNKNLDKARQVARDHIAERPDYYQKLKKMEKSPVSIKEENGVGAIRGLGYFSGDPAVDPVSQYINTNAMAYEDQNGNVLKLIKKQKGTESLGFTPYNPTQDHGDVKTRILGKKIIKELAGAESGTYDDYAGEAPLNVSKRIQSKVEEGKKIEKAKKIGMAAITASNLYTLGDVASRAASGSKTSAKQDIVRAATTLPGPAGWAATGVHYAKKAYDKLKKEDVGPLGQQAIAEMKASTIGKAVAKAAMHRKELTSKKMGDKEIKQWWKRERLVRKGTEKLTGKSKVPATLDEYVNKPGNEYTKPYFTNSLVRTTRTSHEHIRKPDTIEEPQGSANRDTVTPNGKK